MEPFKHYGNKYYAKKSPPFDRACACGCQAHFVVGAGHGHRNKKFASRECKERNSHRRRRTPERLAVEQERRSRTQSRSYLINRATEDAYIGADDYCVLCGQTEKMRLLWHHRDGEEKRFEISAGRWRSPPTFRLELEKCERLCMTCHRLRHNGRTYFQIRFPI